MLIESLDNSKIKLCKEIQNKKYSKLHNLCFLETDKIVLDCMNFCNIKTVLINENVFKNYEKLFANKKYEILKITNKLCKYLSQTECVSNIFAIAEIPNNKFNNCNFLVLDNLQDPANMGAIIRSAVAFGYNKIISINSVYPYTYKVIRSSMGYVFKVEFENLSETEFIEKYRNSNLICADMSGEEISNINKVTENYGIVIGNEGNGVNSNIKNICNKIVKIPMQNSVESLNASVSAGIIMYEFNKKL